MEKFFSDIVNGSFKTTINAKGLMTLQQTQRNGLRADATKVFADMLKEFFKSKDLEDDCKVYLTKDGIVVAVYNTSLDQEICFVMSPSIPALADNGEPYDPQAEEEIYLADIKAKEQAKAKKTAETKAKAERDAKLRAELKAKKGA